MEKQKEIALHRGQAGHDKEQGDINKQIYGKKHEEYKSKKKEQQERKEVIKEEKKIL